MAATSYACLIQQIEGYRVSRLAWGNATLKQPITIGFWTNHARPGVYSVAARNATSDRFYGTTYTHAVANVPQFNTVTIPGCPDGAWDSTNGLGLSVIFGMACGTTYTAPSANTWVTGSYICAPGQINAIASTSDVFRIGGVIVLPGTSAPTAAQSPMIMRPFDQELLLCQRYYWKTFPHNISVGYGPIAYDGMLTASSVGSSGFGTKLLARFPVEMRANPTILQRNPVVANSLVRNFANNSDCASVGVSDPSTRGFVIVASGVNSEIIGHSLGVHATADARF
jgi:hypothetical protein